LHVQVKARDITRRRETGKERWRKWLAG